MLWLIHTWLTNIDAQMNLFQQHQECRFAARLNEMSRDSVWVSGDLTQMENPASALYPNLEKKYVSHFYVYVYNSQLLS